MTVALAGKTALVTGASAGIGREVARLLAREVGTLVLVARRRDRLDELAREIAASRADLRVLVRAVDVTNRDDTAAVLDALDRDGIVVDVLVNNAGLGDYGFFEDRPWEKIEQMLELNVLAATFVLHRLVPQMVARGSGAILNLGSTAGMFPSPGVAVYSATKAYMNLLSEALRAELADTGVTVTLVCPGPVPTEFQASAGDANKRLMPEAFQIDAEQCAREAIEALRAGRARLIPGARVRAAITPLELLPKALIRPFMSQQAKKARRGA